MAAPIPLSVAVLLLSIITVGIYDFVKNVENNSCEMTYMFEYPQYQQIDMGEDGKKFPSYGLHIYGEGSYAKQIRNLKLSGIPVLFIPGNAGSYKQVRSLGSVALRKAEKEGTKGHFNYFVADFNEELSGLYGGVLNTQTEFVHLCVKKILSLYGQSKYPPSTVVLVGHSMGGMIARALFTLPNFDVSTVNTIITQATPHQKPVVQLDFQLQEFYSTVNQFWKTFGNTKLQHVTVVSTGGGFRDQQVHYALTTLDGIVSPDRAISASTTSIPKAWVSTDHLCAVWCRQMILLTKRALFDTIDKDTKQVSNDAQIRMKVFKHHFLSNNGLPDYLTRDENKTITLDPKISWEVKQDRFWAFTSRQMEADKYIAVPFVAEEDNDALLIKSNLSNPEWVCYCDIPSSQEKCATCTSLSSRTRLLPPLYSNSKFLRLQHKDIDITNDTHLVIMVRTGEKKVSITSDRYNSNVRHLVYHMPNTYDTIISYPISATDGAAMLKVSNASTFYSLHLAGLALPTNAYTAIVIPQACRKHSAEYYEGNVLRMNVPWSHEDTTVFSGYGKEISLPIKLQTGRPVDYDWRLDASEPHLEMFLHPYCHYQLRLLVATQDSLGQAIRFYGILAPAFFVATLMMTLSGVLVAHGKGQVVTTKTHSPSDVLFEHGKPYYIIPVIVGLRFIFRLRPISKLLSKFGVPQDDGVSLTEEGIYFSLLPLLLYICAWLATYVQTFLVFNLLSLLSYVGRLFSCIPNSLAERIPILHFVISIVGILSTFLCGSLGLLLASATLILKISHLLYLIGRKLDTRDTHRKLNFYIPIMLLVNWQTMLSLGSFVIWIKNCASTQSWFQQLSPDPSRVPAVIICLCVALILHADDIVPSRSHGNLSGWMVYFMAIVSILYGMESLYRLPTFISLSVAITIVPHLLGLIGQTVVKSQPRKDE